MSRTTEQVSFQEYLRRNPEMSESGGTSSSGLQAAIDASTQRLLSSIANNSIASQAYGIPMNTGSRGPVNTSGLLTMSDAQADAITQQRMADRGLTEGNPFEQPPFEEIERQEGLIDRLNNMLGGIGQSEIGSIWADPTVEEILRANSIRMNPDAPWDQQVARMNPEALEQLREAIQNSNAYQEWLDSQQEEVDPSQSTIPGDTTEDDESLVDQVTGAIDDGVDSVVNSVQDAVDAAIDALPDSASLEDIMDWIEENVTANVQTITPQSIAEEYIGRGVGVNLPTGAPGAGTVFVPGVIPGLPSSSTIIGTVEQILNSPGDVLDQVLGRIEGVVEDPLGTLEAVLRGAADEEGNITAGVLNQVIDDILSGSSRTTPPATQAPSTDEPGTQLGGAGNDTPESATQLVGGADDEPRPALGGTDSDTVNDVIGGAGGAVLGAAAGGAGGMLANKYRYVPQVKRIDFVVPGMPQVIGGKRQRSSIMGLFEEYL